MARPQSIRGEDLLVAARQVFLERGTHATTAQVAERAGVSEGTLFKRFGTKAALFRAAMDLQLAETPLGRIDELVGAGDVESNLIALGKDLIRFFEQLLPLMTMQWSNPRMIGHLPAHLDVVDAPPLRAQRALAHYLDREVALGRVAIPNTAAFARAFLGALNAYVFFEMLARSHREDAGAGLDPDAYVTSFVRAMWNGIRPPGVRSPDDGSHDDGSPEMVTD